MADNFAFTPGAGGTGAADDIGGVLYQRIKVTFGADGSATDVSAASPMPVDTGTTANPSASFTRPADTTAYAIGDLVANSTTAGSVAYGTLTVARVAAGSGQFQRVILFSNHTTGLDGMSFTIHFWRAAPTFTNGDNGVWALATGSANYLGQADVVMAQYADGAFGEATPLGGAPIGFKLASGQVIYWTLQTKSVFTPQSAKTFTVALDVLQD